MSGGAARQWPLRRGARRGWGWRSLRGHDKTWLGIVGFLKAAWQRWQSLHSWAVWPQPWSVMRRSIVVLVGAWAMGTVAQIRFLFAQLKRSGPGPLSLAFGPAGWQGAMSIRRAPRSHLAAQSSRHALCNGGVLRWMSPRKKWGERSPPQGPGPWVAMNLGPAHGYVNVHIRMIRMSTCIHLHIGCSWVPLGLSSPPPSSRQPQRGQGGRVWDEGVVKQDPGPAHVYI